MLYFYCGMWRHMGRDTIQKVRFNFIVHFYYLPNYCKSLVAIALCKLYIIMPFISFSNLQKFVLKSI